MRHWRSAVFRYAILAGVVGVLVGCAAPQPFSERARHIDELVSAAAQAGHFAGVVLVAQRGEVIIERAYPDTDADGQSITTATPFPIASVTKLFTAVLVMQLVEQGRVSLDAPISTYLPGYPRPAGEQITVRHLLTFTSGLPNYEQRTATPIDAYREPRTLDAFVATYLHEPPEAKPGTRFNYSNGDYILLTQIIESVTSQPWPAVLRSQIIAPLGLQHTGVIGTDDPGGALARGRFIDQGRVQPDPLYQAGNYFGAGAMYATASDLLRFERGLAANKILSAESRKRMLTPAPALNGVALGNWVYDQPTSGRRVSEIRGATWGIGTLLESVLDGDQTIILLSQRRDLQGRQLEELGLAIGAALAAPDRPEQGSARR